MHKASLPSLSKAVFVLKPNRKRSPKKKQDSQSLSWSNRRKYYLKGWGVFEDEVDAICESTAEEGKSFVLNYIQSVHANMMQCIPTIVLVMGVNIPDHCKVFMKLSQEICAIECFCVSLQAKDCQSLPIMIQKVVTAVLNSCEDEMIIKKHNCTFQTLAAWYKMKFCVYTSPTKSPRKKAKISKNLKKIVIILEDIESFNPSVLENFILICSFYIDILPLVLVFGVSTAMASVHNLLSQKATAHLLMTVFTPPPASQCLTQIFQMLLENPLLPFRLSPDIYQLLTDHVLYNDFTISSMVHFLKYCLWDHFYSQPTAIFGYETLDKFNQADLSKIEQLPSFSKYVQDTTNKKGPQELYYNLMTDLKQYFKNLLVRLSCLSDLVRDLPGNPFGKQVKDVYLFLNQSLIKSSNYKNTLKLLCLQSPDSLKEKLDLLCVRIENNKGIPGFEKYLEDLQKLSSDAENLKFGNPHEKSRGPKVEIKFEKGIKVGELKEKLKKISNQKPLSRLEQWKQDFVMFLNDLFNMKIPTEVPLHELMLYSNKSSVNSCLLPSPKTAIHQVLLNPSSYLHCKCCTLICIDNVQQSLPPISILYKIHLEHNRLINTYDWLQSFKMVFMQDGPKRRGKKKEQLDRFLQSIFCQALSELHFLGIVKTPKNNSDSVARLTWGPC